LEIASFRSLACPLLLSFDPLPRYQPVPPVAIKQITFTFVTAAATFSFIRCRYHRLAQSVAPPVAQFIVLWLPSPPPSPLFRLLLSSHLAGYYEGFLSLSEPFLSFRKLSKKESTS
jgi:hypothetical protein